MDSVGGQIAATGVPDPTLPVLALAGHIWVLAGLHKRMENLRLRRTGHLVQDEEFARLGASLTLQSSPEANLPSPCGVRLWRDLA